MSVDLSSYIDVAARIAEFRGKHPDGSLQPADLFQPYRVESIGDQTYIVVVAAAYRTPDDPRPGIGMAYEVFPGRTPYTKGSELQNAETSAWGRAIVAVLAADTKRGIASQEEVRNRHAEDEAEDREPTASDIRSAIAKVGAAKGMDLNEITVDFFDWSKGVAINGADDVRLLGEYLTHMQAEKADKGLVAAAFDQHKRGVGREGELPAPDPRES